MQTFLPYPNIAESLTCLDNKRLGKQRVEAKQILAALDKRSRHEKGGWVNHPAVVMWEGYENALISYHNMAIVVWKSRGFNNTMPELSYPHEGMELPHWFGDEDFHDSHQSNLLRKDYDFYSRYGWSVPTDLPYVWPLGKHCES